MEIPSLKTKFNGRTSPLKNLWVHPCLKLSEKELGKLMNICMDRDMSCGLALLHVHRGNNTLCEGNICRGCIRSVRIISIRRRGWLLSLSSRPEKEIGNSTYKCLSPYAILKIPPPIFELRLNYS
jgi:hypothetical protein